MKIEMGKVIHYLLRVVQWGNQSKELKTDWYMKYPNLPKIDAIISWCDDKRHKGTIYKSSNFIVTGKSGGNSHGNGKRKDSGNYLPHKDF